MVYIDYNTVSSAVQIFYCLMRAVKIVNTSVVSTTKCRVFHLIQNLQTFGSIQFESIRNKKSLFAQPYYTLTPSVQGLREIHLFPISNSIRL